MSFINKLFNSIACLLYFINLQLVIPGRTWILLYLGRTVYKRLWACLALYHPFSSIVAFVYKLLHIPCILTSNLYSNVTTSTRINSSSVHMYICVCFIRNSYNTYPVPLSNGLLTDNSTWCQNRGCICISSTRRTYGQIQQFPAYIQSSRQVQ